MKRLIVASLLLLLAVLLMPLLFTRGVPAEENEQSHIPDESAPPAAPAQPVTFMSDEQLRFTATSGGLTAEYSMAEYLPGVLAGEMPASFEPEALKAQAVAARTYIMYRSERTSPSHPEADVCDNASCCEAFWGEDELRARWGEKYEEYMAKLTRAVTETDGQILLYDGEPILAAFHSSSAGRTESGGELWSPLPYLVSVDSPETELDVPSYNSSVEVSAEDFRATILEKYPDARLDGEPASWLGETTQNDSGRTGSVIIGGVSVPGFELRSLFALRSAAFSLEYTGGSFLFRVAGFGHGVGMSQYGANVMAGSGASFGEILAHYYPGAQLSSGANS